MSFIQTRKFYKILIVLGCIALFCQSELGTIILVLCLISIIGWPVAFLLAVIPTVFVFLLLLTIYYHVLKKLKLSPNFLCLPLSLATLMVPPLLMNMRIENHLDSMIASDQKVFKQTGAMTSLAVIQWSPHGTLCTDFCQRMLLSGAVKEILLARPQKLQRSIIKKQKAIKYSLEKRNHCPHSNVHKSGGVIQLPGEKWRTGEPRASDIMQQKIANGLCLIQEPAIVQDAEAVLLYNRISERVSQKKYAFNIFANTTNAKRLSFYIKEENHYVLKYQSTGIQSLKLFPFYSPTYEYGYGLKIYTGLGRYEISRGDSTLMKNQYPLVPFLTKNLSMNLTLKKIKEHQSFVDSPEIDKDTIHTFILQALNQNGEWSRDTKKVITDYFVRIKLNNQKNREEAALSLRILNDKRMTIPRDTAAPIRKYAQSDKALAEKYAKILFDRLFEIDPDLREDDPKYLGYPLKYLGNAIAVLPDEAIIPYKDQLQQLTRDRKARVKAFRALKKLSVFGEEAINDLIFLIDDAPRNKKKFKVTDEWQHTYLAGLLGLCEMGTRGAKAIPMIYERLDNGTIVKFGSYWQLVVNTLVRLGADPDKIWEHVQTEDNNHSRKHFDSKVKFAKRITGRKYSRNCQY